MAKKKPPRARAQSGRSSLSGSRGSSGQDFNPDYRYVIQDLRRIGLLTGTFLVILVVLTFILR